MLENIQISFFTKTFSVGAWLFHADGQTDKHHEANNRFSQFLKGLLSFGEKLNNNFVFTCRFKPLCCFYTPPGYRNLQIDSLPTERAGVRTPMLWDFPYPSRPTLRTSQPPGRGVKELFPVVKLSGPVVDSATTSRAEVKEMVEIYFSTSHHAVRACYKTNKLRGPSPRANYTDRAAAAGRRI